MSLYDQWKTASPYDDDPDPIVEAQRFIKENGDSEEPEILRALTIIGLLIDLI